MWRSLVYLVGFITRSSQCSNPAIATEYKIVAGYTSGQSAESHKLRPKGFAGSNPVPRLQIMVSGLRRPTSFHTAGQPSSNLGDTTKKNSVFSSNLDKAPGIHWEILVRTQITREMNQIQWQVVESSSGKHRG